MGCGPKASSPSPSCPIQFILTVPLLQVQELLQLAAEQTYREVMTTEGGAELAPWDLMISG
jgi:hypothetical protein